MKLRQRNRLPSVKCPSCASGALVRSSYDVSDTVREVRYECADVDECGHVFVAQVAVIRTIRPSLKADPIVTLPLGNQNLRRPRRVDPPPDMMFAATG